MQLIYPTLDLFLYDLRDGLGQTQQQVNQNRHRFQARILPELNPDQLSQWEALEEDNPDLTNPIQLLGKDRFKSFPESEDGYYWPVQIGDTYALQINYSGPKVNGQPNVAPQDICNLTTLQNTLHEQFQHHPGTLGQTYVLWAQLSEPNQSPTQIEAAAQACYQALRPNSHWQEIRTPEIPSQIAGATVYEVWERPKNWKNLAENHHYWICLFPQELDQSSIQKTQSGLYKELIYLFGYRSKILWAYWQSRTLKGQLKSSYDEIQESIQAVSNMETFSLEDLEINLKKTLATLTHYAINLNYLGDQCRTLDLNISNYHKRLQLISKALFEHFPNTEVSPLSQFCELAREKYSSQIHADIANLSPGLNLLENLINTIQGIVDIQQTASDRRLNYTAAAVGTGLAMSQIATSVIVAKNDPKTETGYFFQSHAFQASVGATCIMALLVGLIWLVVLRRIAR